MIIAVASYSYPASNREFIAYNNPQVVIQKTEY